eukprot:GHVP01067237.1.p1 GENE.GHVP01067237.1~~GHVP01067237.1.p1  ORF type:complete len:332 (+),score=47.10 GHVP01067237.1:945-1940(+)
MSDEIINREETEQILCMCLHPHNKDIVFFGGTDNKLYTLDKSTENINEIDQLDDSVLAINIYLNSNLIVWSFKEAKIYKLPESEDDDISNIKWFKFEEDIEWCSIEGDKLISGNKDCSITIIDINTGEVEFLYSESEVTTGFTFTDRQFGICSATNTGSFYYWNGDQQSLISKYNLRAAKPAICTMKQPNTMTAAIGYEDGSVSLIHIGKGTLLRELPKHNDSVEVLHFGKVLDREYFVSCSLDGVIFISWLNVSRPTKTLDLESGATIIVPSPGFILYIGCINGSVFKLDIRSYELTLLNERTDEPILCMFLLDLTLICASSTINEIKLL